MLLLGMCTEVGDMVGDQRGELASGTGRFLKGSFAKLREVAASLSE